MRFDVALVLALTIVGCSQPAEDSKPVRDVEERPAQVFSSDVFRAISNGDLELLRSELARGADVDPLDPDGDEETPLSWAAGMRSPESAEAIRLLLEHGADIYHRSKEGLTPLHYAAWQGSIKNIQLILAAGVPIDIRTTLPGIVPDRPDISNELARFPALNGRTPLNAAVGRGYAIESVAYLLGKGADPALAGATGLAPLHAAASKWYVAMVRLLLEGDAPPSPKDDLGLTPLHALSGEGGWRPDEDEELQAIECASWLIKYGADLNARDGKGRTPLDCAKSAKLKKLAKFLEEAH